MIEGHAFRFGLEPADLDAAAVLGGHVAEGLRCVKAAAAVAGQLGLFGLEAGSIEAAHGVFAVGAEQDPLLLGGVAVDGQFEEIRAFKEEGGVGGAFADAAQGPLAQVRRLEKVHGGFAAGETDVEDHDPLFGGGVPHYLGVAVALGDLGEHGVGGVFGEGASVGAVGDSLHGGISGGGIEEDEGRVVRGAEAAGVIPVDDRAAAEHGAHGIGEEFVAQFLPVDHVFANSVSPVHIAPAPAVGIVLEKEVVFAAVENHSVGVVVPAAAGGEMELSAEGFTVEMVGLFEGIVLGDGAEGGGILGQFVDAEGEGFAHPGADIHGRPPIGGAVGEFDVVAHGDLAVDEQGDDAFGGAVFDGEVEVARGGS